MQANTPITKNLVLVGGGHSHAIVLRKIGMNPWPEHVQVILITNLADTPYSGMLPCHISGLYDFDTAHIDLRPLTRFANTQLIMDQMIGLDPDKRKVICRDHPPIAYDTLSIDIGSTPTKSQVPGAAQYATPAKPVPALLQAWAQYLEQLETALISNPQTPATISIVGGGVGGVEMAFAMQVRLWELVGKYSQTPKQQVTVHIFHRGAHLAKGRNVRTQHMIEQMCQKRGIEVHTQQTVARVSADAVRTQSGKVVKCDRTFWVTNAAAPPWLTNSNLTLTPDGFIAVKDTLQTLGHPNIFAAGDVATMVNHQRPKAGVFAVRQGPPLYENLKRHVLKKSLKTFKPQRRYLNIIDTGLGDAIASWGPFAVRSKWSRRWKDSIDRKFMGLFSDFPDMETNQEPGKGLNRKSLNSKAFNHKAFNSKLSEQAASLFNAPPSTLQTPAMHCSGCGSKVGSKVLSRTLARVRADSPGNTDWPYRNNIYAGIEALDDAAIIQIPSGKLAVHTVDHFSALIKDPFVFGQICVNHCLSDLFAMGATSHNVLAIATIPYGTQTAQEETLYQLLSGAHIALSDAKTFLVGGHTTEGPELALGFSCNGWIDPDQLWRKGNARAGQALILTKALGTGSLFAADQQGLAKGRWVESAVTSMLQSNRLAAECFKQHGATACTDVTGFGLAGHLLEMVTSSGVDVALDLSAIAHLPGSFKTLEQKIVSSLHQRNLQNAITAIQLDRSPIHLPSFQILFDPQTSGGLLASVPISNVEACLSDLHHMGYTHSHQIGLITDTSQRPSGITKPITITAY
ncbi:MAG: selenide, water dikinase SelD [Cyanobacteria bacterium J06554_3]